MPERLPLGKLPVALLRTLLDGYPPLPGEVLVGPGIGLDCAVVETSGRLMVLKSDPITFASDAIGWYLVQVHVNDVVTTGALPRYLLVTLLIPEKDAPALVETISRQIREACAALQISVIGGHTEITHGIDRPILVGTLIGEVDRTDLITPAGVMPGDRLLLTKRLPIEATAILAREFPDRLGAAPIGMSPAEIILAQNYLYDPGISIYAEARLAILSGGVHAMHDPTEGGLYTALWELSEACQHSLRIDLQRIPVDPLARRICQALDLDPLGAIASGALLLAVAPEECEHMIASFSGQGIECSQIGEALPDPGPPCVWVGSAPGSARLPRPDRDEIAKLYHV